MDWSTPFAIYRITPDGTLEQVHLAPDLKAAKYWLTYIAQPGDVLCKTPAHPKHSKASKKPEYWSHKEASGTPLTKEDTWRKFAESKNCKIEFPEKELEFKPLI